jgi:hypothetical protein
LDGKAAAAFCVAWARQGWLFMQELLFVCLCTVVGAASQSSKCGESGAFCVRQLERRSPLRGAIKNSGTTGKQ